jgi:SAM-dependent methyltransferase
MTERDDLVGKALGDLAGAWSASLVVLGDKLGLWKALAGAGPVGPAQLAVATGVHERYLLPWLAGMAAAGYVDYADGLFTLTDAQARIFADDTSPVYLTGLAGSLHAVHRDLPAIAEAYRCGEGRSWGGHHADLSMGIETWLPALVGVVGKLERGATVADVGCGHGGSTRALAEAYPASTFAGFDARAASIERATELAKRAGLDERVRFETAPADAFAGGPYDLICLLDCLHDLGDPVAALEQCRRQLAADGTVLLVEPYAGDQLEDNLTPVGQVFYAASATICVPNAVSQRGPDEPLGAQAGPRKLIEVAHRAGFTGARVATSSPFSLILELKP